MLRFRIDSANINNNELVDRQISTREDWTTTTDLGTNFMRTLIYVLNF